MPPPPHNSWGSRSRYSHQPHYSRTSTRPPPGPRPSPTGSSSSGSSIKTGPVTATSHFTAFRPYYFYHQDLSTVSKNQPTAYRDPYVSASELRMVRWNNAGSKLAVIQSDRNVRIWTTDNPDPKQSIEIRYGSSSFRGTLVGICWDPANPDIFVVVSADGIIKMSDARTKETLHEFDCGQDAIVIKWSPDGEVIAVVRIDNVVVFLDRQLKNLNCNYTVKGKDITEFCWSNSSSFFTYSVDTGPVNICKLDYKQAKEVKFMKALKGHRTAVGCIAFEPSEGKLVALGSNDGTVSIWNLDSELPTCIKCYSCRDRVHSISFTHDGVYLAIATTELSSPGSSIHPKIEIISVATGENVMNINRTNCVVRPCIQFHPSKYVLATTGESSGMSVYGYKDANGPLR